MNDTQNELPAPSVNVSATELSPTPAKKPSLLSKVGNVAGKALGVAKWAWSIPFIKSAVGTKLTQAGVVGALAYAVTEKALGN